MSSSRPRRSTHAPAAAPVTMPSEPSRRSRPSRGAVQPKVEDPDEDEDEDGEEEDEEDEPAAGPSRRGRTAVAPKRNTRPSVSVRGRTKTEDVQTEAEGEGEDTGKPYRVRNRKSVSYREVPVDEIEEDVDVDDEELTDQADDLTSPPPARSSQVPDTPSKRRRRNPDDDIEIEDKSNKFEKVGSGRGGFSVKGAAAAAARARWAKVRKEKEERGDVDDGEPRRKGRIVRRENKAAVEKLKDGELVMIRGVEYTAMNDELSIPDDPKGNTKVDAWGKLSGDREYKVFIFSSEGRDDSERLYALTIDVARACGYVDSLAFLRRFPVIQKLQCQPGEAEMLIEVGRVAGNMKHRMVTIVPMRNVFKLMGARIIKDGKWVTDDYYEDESLAKCAENGYTPYAPAIDEEILGHANGAQTRGERERDALISSAATKTNVLSPFYTIGGPSTHFGGAGIDPWTDGGHGNKHARMKSIGVHAEDWMYRTAKECRIIDAGLRRYRDERIGMLEGRDLDGWVLTAESVAEQPAAADQVDGSPEKGTREEVSGLEPNTGLKPPTMERQRSGLSREVTFEPEPEPEQEQGPTTGADVSMDNLDVKGLGAGTGEDDNDTTALTPLPENDGIDHAIRKVIGGELRIETPAEAEARKQKWSRGTGQWEQGTIMASYEPHTHMPHVPLFTQPTQADISRISPYPILQSFTDSKHLNFVQSTVRGAAAKGLASIEYVFDRSQSELELELGGEDYEAEARLKVIQEAEEWERRGREKAEFGRVGSASVAPTPIS